MKISDIKYILAKYPKFVVSAEKFLNRFAYHQDDYELTVREFIDLIAQVQPDHIDHHFGLSDLLGTYELLLRRNLTAAPIKEDDHLHILFSLTDGQLARMGELICNLYNANLLNEDSFAAAVKTVKSKLPPVELHVATDFKLFRKRNHFIDHRTNKVRIDNQIDLYFSHHSSGKGSYGKIKKGYTDDAPSSKAYTVKELLDSTNLPETIDLAEREVKFNRLLGRNSYYFINNEKCSIVYDWQEGKSLHTFSSFKIAKNPIKSRLKAARSALSELHVLHQHHRVHGDIKLENIIYDPTKESLHLIDFGSAHKQGSFKWFGHTPNYYDKCRAIGLLEWDVGFSFCDDVFAMSVIFTKLFPDLLTQTYECIHKRELLFKTGHSFTDRLFPVIQDKKQSFESIHERAIKMLVHAMSHNETGDLDAVDEARKQQCTAKDALLFCDAILENWDNANEERLKEIANATIHHSTITVDDVFHGHLKKSM